MGPQYHPYPQHFQDSLRPAQFEPSRRLQIFNSFIDSYLFAPCVQAKVAIDVADKVKTMSGEDAAKLFEERVLSYYPRLFHEWFVERFPEPTQWLACRNAYSRTAAVMSMVGYILGYE